MGAWGVSTFENDDAVDWLEELIGSVNLLILYSTFEMLEEDYLECPDGCNALAAAEVVAALNNQARASFPEQAKQWVATHKNDKSDDLLDLALNAVDKVISKSSELNELWKKSDEYGEWLKDVASLKLALKA